MQRRRSEGPRLWGDRKNQQLQLSVIFARSRAHAPSTSKLMGWSAAEPHGEEVECGERRPFMEIQTIGIDLGKTLFHLVGVDASGSVVVRKRCSRSQLVAFTANLRVQRIGMEACSGSHFLGRTLRDQGHDVRLMRAQYVKPYVTKNKSDYIDAEAIAEAVQRPTMRFVPIKTEDQLDLQAVHRVRER